MKINQKIDDLLEIDEVNKVRLELTALQDELKAIKQDKKRVEKAMDDVVEEGPDFEENEEWIKLSGELDSIRLTEVSLYRQIEEKEKEYKQSEKKIVNIKEKYGYMKLPTKTDFLDELFSERHIGWITEDVGDARTFFGKLLKLYGEETLANYKYEITDEKEVGTPDTLTIQDFISGYEEVVLDLVTSDNLRRAILGEELEKNELQQNEPEKTYNVFGSVVTEKEERLGDMSIDDLATLLIDHPERANDIWRVMVLEEKDMDELYKAVGSQMLPDGTIVDDYGRDFNETVEEALEEIASWSGYDSAFDYEYDEEERENRKRHQAQMREIQETLSDNIAYGDTPKMLREFCERKGYTLEDWYDTETLKEAYKRRGYEYDPESDTITEIGKSLTAKDLQEADDTLTDIYLENPEWLDDRPDSIIPEGISVEEFTEITECDINEYGEIIRPSEKESDISDISPDVLAWLSGESTPLKKREEELSRLEAEEKTISEAEALIDKATTKEGQDIGEE